MILLTILLDLIFQRMNLKRFEVKKNLDPVKCEDELQLDGKKHYAGIDELRTSRKCPVY